MIISLDVGKYKKILKRQAKLCTFCFFEKTKQKPKICPNRGSPPFIEYSYLGLKILNFKQTQFFVNYFPAFSIFEYLKQFCIP